MTANIENRRSVSSGHSHPHHMHTVPCRSGRRELWLLLVVVVTGILMAAAVFLPAVLG